MDDSAKRVLRGDEGETEMSLELSPQQENTVSCFQYQLGHFQSLEFVTFRVNFCNLPSLALIT